MAQFQSSANAISYKALFEKIFSGVSPYVFQSSANAISYKEALQGKEELWSVNNSVSILCECNKL